MEFDEYGNKYEGTDEMIWFDEESAAPGNYGSNNSMYNYPGGSRSGGRYAEPPLVPRYQEHGGFFWGRGYGPAGPPKQQQTSRENTVSFLLGCGVPHYSLSGLPNILLRRMEPECCGICSQELNSFSAAQLHYTSKHHVRNVKKWLIQQAQAGSQGPKEIPIRARGLYCELCDIHITSKAHAESHYGGRPHRSIVEGRRPPKNPFLLQKNMEERVEKLIRREKNCLKPVQTSAAKEKVKAKKESKPVPPELRCDICSNIQRGINKSTPRYVEVLYDKTYSVTYVCDKKYDEFVAWRHRGTPMRLYSGVQKTTVTCSEQMTMHLNGKKHLAKEKQDILKKIKANPAGTTDSAKDADAQNVEAHDAVAKGTDTQGSVANGTDTQGSVAKGTDTQGSVAKGTDTQGSVAKGTDTQGSVTKGTDTQGSVAKGTDTQGSVAKGTDTQGSVAKGAESQEKAETDVQEHDFDWGQGSSSWDDDPQ